MAHGTRSLIRTYVLFGVYQIHYRGDNSLRNGSRKADLGRSVIGLAFRET
jgi:hypothetical protein